MFMLASLSVFLCTMLVPQSKSPRFRAVVLEDLGYGGEALAINASGVSVGSVKLPTGWRAAARWNAEGALTVLGRGDSAEGCVGSGATGISSDALVAGYTLSIQGAPSAAEWLPSSSAGHVLPPPGAITAAGVSPSGHVLVQLNWGKADYALLRGGQLRRIDFTAYGRALSVNSEVRVSGWESSGHAFRWTDGVFEDLPPPLGSTLAVGWWITEDGTVIGESGDGEFRRVTFWKLDNAAHVLQPAVVGAKFSQGFCGNASGWIVGAETATTELDPHVARTYGALWVSGTGHVLNALIEAGPPVLCSEAKAVNDRGQIVGKGRFDGVPTELPLRLDPL